MCKERVLWVPKAYLSRYCATVFILTFREMMPGGRGTSTLSPGPSERIKCSLCPMREHAPFSCHYLSVLHDNPAHALYYKYSILMAAFEVTSFLKGPAGFSCAYSPSVRPDITETTRPSCRRPVHLVRERIRTFLPSKGI